MTDKTVFKIVLTGGPCAGKTTVLSTIKERVSALGFDVLVVPEAATLLIGGGFTYNREDSNEAANFQLHLLELQMTLEEAFLAKAWSSGKKTLIICDRGAMDGKAFCTKEAWSIVESMANTNTVALRDERYDAVIHLETAAIGAPEFYTCANNPARVEKQLVEAIAVDSKLKIAWTGCPHFRVIRSTPDFKQKTKEVLTAVSRVIGEPLPLEIERRFLVESVSELPVHYEEFEIIQHYLNSGADKTQERIRERRQNGASVFFHTFKTENPDGGGRIERERIVTPQEYAELSCRISKDRRSINKLRKCFLWNNQYFELDYFRFPRPGLSVLEVELDSADEKVTLPSFISVSKEITTDPEFSNFNLSLEK